MLFTIARTDLESLLKAAGISRRKKCDLFTISACAGRVFVEFAGDVAGVETVVLAEGAVTLSAKPFGELVKTYRGTHFLRFEAADASGLMIENLRVPITGYEPKPRPPGNFRVFPVTDAFVTKSPVSRSRTD